MTAEGRTAAEDRTFALQPDEPLGAGLRRCAAEELDGAVDRLRSIAAGDPAAGDAGDGDAADAVHAARKSCKKVRALLRMARAGIGEDVRDAENVALRDAAGLLSPARDVEVLAGLLADLAAQEGAPSGLPDAVSALQARRDGLVAVVTSGDAAAAAARVEAVRARVDGWVLDGDVDTLLASGLRKVARQERTRRDRALAAGVRPEPAGRAEVDDLRHDWRKRAKDLWYASRLLAEVSEPAAAAVDRLDALGDALGEDHDAAVLAACVRAEPGASGVAALLHGALPRPEEREQVLVLLEQRRAPLVEQAQALALGRPHAADPDALVASWLAPLLPD